MIFNYTLLIGGAFVIGLIFDAIGSLPYFLAVASVAAIISALLLILATGLDLMLILMGLLGLLGIHSSWDRLFIEP